MVKHNFLVAIFLLCGCLVQISAQSPEVQVLTTGTHTSLRGLSVVNDNVIWVSGSGGMVGKSTNAGRTWNWITVSGYDTVEFRDIEAFDSQNALIMAVGEPAYILGTNDGGQTWVRVYENHTKGMFLDAMDFSDNFHGLVVGDPVDGRAFIAETFDSGKTWKEWPAEQRPQLDSGEAFFAASGTNVRLFPSQYYLVSGGMRSRLFTKNGTVALPLLQGQETTGANSISVYNAGKKKGSDQLIVVGGDFFADSSTTRNCFYSLNGGKSWKAPLTPPHGYRSCVEYVSKQDVFACGLTGVDYSPDSGKRWTLLSRESFNVCRIAKLGTAIFLAGNNGRIAKIIWR